MLVCDADGAHVGQSDMPVDIVQSLLDPDKIIACKLVGDNSFWRSVVKG